MSRTYDQHPHRTRTLYRYTACERSWDVTVYAEAESNAPSSYRKMWRRQARVRQNRALIICKDLDELQIETKITKITSIYDWY